MKDLDIENMAEMSVSEFKATCLKVMDKINRTGESILITKRGEPSVMVSPAPSQIKERKTGFGSMRGEFSIVGDIVSPIVPASEWDVLK